MYADDLILLALLVRDLQLLVNICIQEFQKIGLEVNIKKTSCIRIGPRYDKEVVPILINNNPLAWVQEINYLGIKINSAFKFTVNWQNRRHKYFRALIVYLAKSDQGALLQYCAL